MRFSELGLACDRRGWKLVLELIGPTGHWKRSGDIGEGCLRARVLDGGGDVIAGRCQSDPGVESIDELAASIAEILRRHGVAL